MSVQLCVLASGSAGNCIYIGSEDTRLLIDAGLNARQIALRLEQIGLKAEALHALCISHEHTDHIQGSRVLHRRYGLELYASRGTLDGMGRKDARFHELPWKLFTNGSAFEIGTFRIEPFSVPHDAYEPSGFVVETPDAIIGVATDLGVATGLIREKLKCCHAVVVECNHDPRLLSLDEKRPWRIKQRIMGRTGHLSNEAAAELLLEAAAGGVLRHAFLAHLSGDCNEPGLALETVRRKLDESGHAHIRLEVASQHQVSSVWLSQTE